MWVSAQPGNVISQRADFAVIELGGYLVHLQAVFTHTIAKRRQLRGHIFSMLTRKAWVLRRNASARGAVAARAGSNLPFLTAIFIFFIIDLRK